MTSEQEPLKRGWKYTCPTCGEGFQRFTTENEIGGLCPHCLTKVSHRV